MEVPPTRPQAVYSGTMPPTYQQYAPGGPQFVPHQPPLPGPPSAPPQLPPRRGWSLRRKLLVAGGACVVAVGIAAGAVAFDHGSAGAAAQSGPDITAAGGNTCGLDAPDGSGYYVFVAAVKVADCGAWKTWAFDNEQVNWQSTDLTTNQGFTFSQVQCLVVRGKAKAQISTIVLAGSGATGGSAVAEDLCSVLHNEGWSLGS